MANQKNNHAAQMNSHQIKRRLLLWLIGLSFFNIVMLLVVLLLIIFAPALLQRCAAWKAKSQLKYRTHIMKKLNLVELKPHSDAPIQSQLQIPTVAATVTQSVPTAKVSYEDPSQRLEAQKHLVIKLARDLKTGHKQLPSDTPTSFPRIT